MGTEVAKRLEGSMVAVSTDQMLTAHEQMQEWAAHRVAQLHAELGEEQEALTIAERNKWAVTRHRRRVRALERRCDFFSKIAAALEAGYVIVPNFPLDIFAIRTDRAQPALNSVSGGSWHVRAQSSRVLPAGDGKYRNPQTEVETHEWKEGETTKRQSNAVGPWQDIDFPIALAKPSLMGKTAEALALHCFDEIGVADASVAKGDPYIIGRIRNPGTRADISFFIGWTFDPGVL